ncbi:MAG TPA: hypothetical protein VG675_24580 [Bryobacteraceae bacterium]|nr:hypothetical protein [Bryobacteraceae bacterium]
MKLLGWLVSFGLITTAGRVITFDTAPLGQTPPGWTIAMTNRGEPPVWQIMRDHTAATQPYVFAQLSKDTSAGRYPLAILDNPKMHDGDLSVRLKPVSGRDDRDGGLVWRYRDPNNYYLVRADALAGNVAVYKVENGRFLSIQPNGIHGRHFVKHTIPTNGWSILKVSVRGNRFQVYVNHRRILRAQDDTFTGAGRVGLWTAGDSVTYFDDFRVNPK